MMINELVNLDKERLHAFEISRRQKERVVKAYNKKGKSKDICEWQFSMESNTTHGSKE